MATYNLTSDIDNILGTPEDDLVIVNYDLFFQILQRTDSEDPTRITREGDRLDGGAGHDTISLVSGTYQFGELSLFNNFETVLLNGGNYDLSFGRDTTPLAIRDIRGGDFGSQAGIHLAGNSVSVISGAASGSSFGVTSDNSKDWNNTNVFDGSAYRNANDGNRNINIDLEGKGNSTFYDLTANSFNAVQTIYSRTGGIVIQINSVNAIGVASFFSDNENLNQILTTDDASLDLSQTTVHNFTVISSNIAGTSFTAKDASSALRIYGGTGQDIIIASDFAFTQAQRNEIFATKSIETITDSTGTYINDVIHPDLLAPKLQIALSDSNLTRGEISHVTFTFSEAVHGFALSDVFATHGQFSNLTTVDEINFDAVYTPQSAYSGSDLISVASGSYTDIAGNVGAAAQAALSINTVVSSGIVLKGTAANDTLFGFERNDQLDGKGGADKMFGGLGNDTYFVDNAADLVIENADEGNDSVNASVSFTLGANVENLQLSGTSKIDGTGNALANDVNGNKADNVLSGLDGRDALRGNGGNDTLDGGTGDDYLSGGAGADILIGGTGGDAMYGGAGADTFRFTSLADFGPATHPDTIGDFNAAEGDIIDLLGVDADIRDGFAGDQAFTFIGSDKFSHSAGELRASGSGGYLTVSGDVNGDGQADFAFIVKAAVLHHSDFIL